MRISPAVGSSKPATMRSVVVLPQPEGPSSVRNSPERDLEVDGVDRRDLAEALRDSAELDVRRGGRIPLFHEPEILMAIQTSVGRNSRAAYAATMRAISVRAAAMTSSRSYVTK